MIKTPSNRHYTDLVNRLRQPRLALVDQGQRPRPTPDEIQALQAAVERARRLLHLRSERLRRKVQDAAGHDD